MLPQVTKARRGEATRTYRVGWAPSAALGFAVLECHEYAMLTVSPVLIFFPLAFSVARMTGAAEIDVLHLISYSAKAVAVSESAAAEAEAFEAEE